MQSQILKLSCYGEKTTLYDKHLLTEHTCGALIWMLYSFVINTKTLVRILLFFWSFEMIEGIFGKQKVLLGLDLFSKQFYNVGVN